MEGRRIYTLVGMGEGGRLPTHHGTPYLPPGYVYTLYHPGYTTILCHTVLVNGAATLVGRREALGSNPGIITTMRRIEAFLLPKVWKKSGSSAQSCSLSPGMKV